MAFGMIHLSISARRRLVSILLAMGIFALLGCLTTLAAGRPLRFGISNAILIGMGIGVFEEFYVQSLRGRWLRSMHPLRSILVYALVAMAIFLVAIHLSHLILWRLDDLPTMYRRLPFIIPVFMAFSVVCIVVMRVVHFVGAETLLDLMVGTYHRPVLKTKVLLFLDINDSAAIAERLGMFETKDFVGKFLFDISQPITDHGGEIYVYKGDGLIAMWDWNEAVKDNRLLGAVDAMFATVRREHAEYRRRFGVVPSFRVGIHGGQVVVSEQGDIKRAIGIYGDTINIAARMEEEAKALGVACVISGDVAEALDNRDNRLLPIGTEKIKGISAPVAICRYLPAGEPAGAPERLSEAG